MIEYPKIETLFDRDPQSFKLLDGVYRLPEFAVIDSWEVTEKLDGTNVRVHFAPGEPVRFGGRTAAAQIPVSLIDYLQDTFTLDRAATALKLGDAPITLFGEGYGPKIQSGGNYRASVKVRLFDVLVGQTWLTTETVAEIAAGFGTESVPVLGVKTTEEAVAMARDGFTSIVANVEGGNHEYRSEGIVARSSPLLLDRMGRRVMWKLKERDWRGGKR